MILIFFPLVAGNVLLTEDGTVKLGKAWDVALFFLALRVFIISRRVLTGIFKNDNERIRQ